MKSKQAKEVVLGLKERMFKVFGLPCILHSDNGREFANNLIVGAPSHGCQRFNVSEVLGFNYLNPLILSEDKPNQ